MARQESDREDLMREATALVERAEFRVPGESEPVVFGLRREGAASFFFGPDPVFHFNSRYELRRSYVGGDLIKAEHRRAVRLRRVRTESETQLQRSELSPEETAALLHLLQTRLAHVRASVEARQIEVVAAHPPGADLTARLQEWLAAAPAEIALAARPNVQ